MNPTTNQQASLKRRVRQFYAALNAGAFEKCYHLIDPRLLAEPGTVTLFQYENALAVFLQQVGGVTVRQVTITGLHLGQPNKLYEGRDFALGKTVWEDAAGNTHQFAERWVCENGLWYTRSTGLLPPASAQMPTKPVRGGIQIHSIRKGIERIKLVPRSKKPAPPKPTKKPTRM